MSRIAKCLLPLACMLIVWKPPPCFASWVEPLFMPGEVAEKHADVERECGKCHKPFDKAAQDGLCLACHTDVAADLDAKRGHHGREPSVRSRRCNVCHTEHEGRDADIVRLDRDTFAHRYTDLQLRGAHERVKCDGCHTAGKRYRDAPLLCDGCHAASDPHDGTLGAACDDCHDETVWNKANFDHDGSAFPLQGKHRDAACQDCHRTKKYKPTARECSACHEKEDRHRGALGSDCASCHTPQTWTAARYDHERWAHFPLFGRHLEARCESCHRPGTGPDRLPSACHGCHEKDDAHQGRFGRACETCHTPVEWRRHTFDHDRRTSYPLRGGHRQTRCVDCHQGRLDDERLDPSCYACHRGDDVHAGREGTRCDSCHDERDWSRGVLFDHDSTTFPLLGAHTRTACMQCHTSASFKDVARKCVSCHEAEDVHAGKLGPQCERCHEASSFKVTHEPD